MSKLYFRYAAMNAGKSTNLLQVAHNYEEAFASRPACILIDETQFLTPDQVRELHRLAHSGRVPVICYGLRTDIRGAGFPGALELLAIADALEEIKTICRCGRKASMTIRLDSRGERLFEGEQVQVGGNETYESVCPPRLYCGSC